MIGILARALTTSTFGLLATGMVAQDQLRVSRNLVYPVRPPTTIYNSTAGDIDGDGRMDLIYACDYSGVAVYVNNGRGGFLDETAARLPRPLQYASYEVDAIDMDGDGDLDLVVANDHIYANKILINDGTGRFADQSATRFPANGHWTTAQELLDVDGDGDLDIFFLNSLGQRSHLFLNDGKARFTDVSATHLPSFAAPYKPGIEHGDLDGDGDLDMIVENTPSLVLENTGQGRFKVSTRMSFPSAAGAEVAIRDFDGDGRVDVFFRRTNRYFLASGPGTFLDVTTTHLPPLRRVLAHPVDVDLDGDVDLCGDQRLLLNDGRGRFSDASTRMVGARMNLTRPTIADFDGDGDDDIACTPDKILVNFHRQLETPKVPAIGQAFDVDYWVRPGYAPSSTMALPALAHSPGKVAIALPPLGRFQLDPALFMILPIVTVPAATGQATVRYLVPAAPALRGVTLSFQALWNDLAGQPRLGNHTFDVIQ